MKVLESKELRIRIKSPVHVGCGEVYDPFSFIVDDQKRELLILDMSTFIKNLPPDLINEFSRICQKGTPDSLLEMYKFLRRIGERRDIVSKNGVVARRVSLVEGFINHYNEVVGAEVRNTNGKVITKFAIERTAYDPIGGFKPIIPGSSIKGALRTAVLNVWKSKASLKNSYSDNESLQLEKDILGGSFSSDPFSLVKVSDFLPVGEVKTKIVYAVNCKKAEGEEGKGPCQIFETVIEGEFKGTISVMRSLARERGIKKPLSIEELLIASRKFYTGELKREVEEMKKMKGVYFNWKSRFDLQKEVPLRIGRHSGAECVTIEGFRRIKIMGSNKKLDHATTLWLASADRKPKACAPFGWCVLVN
ncbi:type III-A CRISPR-associated RAMP protein Csm5 [Thermodesulforhabdus norvegica]|uniref:CRISPR system Cms protein Csm5 n=1 Tax=Thermodesulforhabdus norvegica TaxID=39841 RepID=A0A1I4S7E1_9BACT|nr:type III-A CRISPR-associated RAMP protein Csm5 [Thermodesulforhabdus norvegica]SFM60379.1 CRISPR-associated protein Csm5 [Thermodesulforhabdus norvegica]